MQASQQHQIFTMYRSKEEADAYFFPPFPTLDYSLHYKDCSHETYFLGPAARERNSNLEASPVSSIVCLSSIEGPILQEDCYSCIAYPCHSPEVTDYSPINGSCMSNDANDLRHRLRELESEMLAPDADILGSFNHSFQGETNISPTEMNNWREMMEMISGKDLQEVLGIITGKDLREVLVACAKALSDGDNLMAKLRMDELHQIVSVNGEPVKRLGAYMLEGLVAKFYGSKIPPVVVTAELLSHMHTLFEICPYFKFGCMAANGAIAEAMKDEDRVHIIDFRITQAVQWITLIQAFAARPGGPPHIRLTGTYDPTPPGADNPLIHLRKKLMDVAKLAEVPFEFHSLPMSASDVLPEKLGLQPGEALAVNFAFMLHHVPDESVSTENHRDRLLRLVKSLSPKVVTLVEQESNTNTAPFLPRFLETLSYYTAVFDSIDTSFQRDQKERINIEEYCLARDVVNIIASDGNERVERYEPLGKWRSRFVMAGFTPYTLSSFVNGTIKDILLQNYSSKYRIEERNGALYLGWMDRDLVAVCAWK